MGTIPDERPGVRKRSNLKLKISKEEQLRILNQSERQAQIILHSIEDEVKDNSNLIEQYIKLIISKKEQFIQELGNHERSLDDECDLQDDELEECDQNA